VTTLFESELREQPAALARLLGEGRDAAEAAARVVRARGAGFAVVAARGSSDNAARYAQYVLGIRNRLVASLATPSLFTQYHAAPSLAGSLVIGISQSGQSPDIVEVVREARRQGAVSLAITNDPDSPLASAAELVLPLRAGPEKAVAATKTYTAQVLALAMLSAALDGDEQTWRELDGVPDRVAGAIERNAATADAAGRFRDRTGLVVVGRGYNLATAFEVGLKVKETSGILTDAYSSADFFHGPKAILQPGLPVLVVAPGPREFPDLDDVVELVEQTGSPLLAISDRRELLEVAELAMPLPPDTPEWLSPIVAITPGQLFALGLSLARGMHPDAPPGLSKVTRTR
jgi:glucosamine--fructose-6-phosphate aminotransferase (isomerizing)